MGYQKATTDKAIRAIELVTKLQNTLKTEMELVSDSGLEFKPVTWLRDEGKHGGGERFVGTEDPFFNTASINVSHVQYDDLPEKRLASATAFSAIIHPNNPHLPSVHFHFSWTEMRGEEGYWRMMADLNPALVYEDNAATFVDQLEATAADFFEEGIENGDVYFYIPALQQHRGISHFYLEAFNTGNFESDILFAEQLATNMIKTYGRILKTVAINEPTFGAEEKRIQLDYHTLYVYQVLTLDKGTTAGILVHNQNDLGVLGSLPAVINPALLLSWAAITPKPFDILVTNLVACLPTSGIIDVTEKLAFANVMRQFYTEHSAEIKLKGGH